MADPQDSTATATPREFTIPVDNPAPDAHVHAGKQFNIPVEGKQFSIPVDAPAPPPPKLPANLPEIKPWNPNWHERLFGSGGFSGAVRDAAMAGYGGDKTEVVKAFLNHPLAAIDELIFPGNQRTPATQFLKSATKSVSGLTSPTMLGMTAASYLTGLGEAKTIAGGLHAVGTAMMPTMAVGMANSVQQIKQARATGNSEAEMDAWGDLAGNIALVAVPHIGGKVVEGVRLSEFNGHAQELYGKKFSALDDNQKLHVVYKASVDANPKLAKKVERETQRINSQKVPGEGGRTVAEVRQTNLDDTIRKQNEDAVKLQAYRNVLNQVIRQQAVDEHYRQTRAEAEAQVRAQRLEATRQQARREAIGLVRGRLQQDRDEAAARVAKEKSDETPSIESQRGFAVDDQRANTRGDRGYITGTERESYPVHAPGTAPQETMGLPVSDTRTVPGPETVQRSIEAERPIQEYAEKEHGASFSSLPLSQQQVVASHFERNAPEQWKAFQQTQAFDAYRRHAAVVEASAPAMKRFTDAHEGTGEPLNPEADIHAGVARLILQYSDVPAKLKASPELYQRVNDYAYRNLGKSFDSMDETERPAALAGFLRDNPDSLDSFTTPEISERLKQGQAVDLANMEASFRDRQQVETLMQYRDATRAAMDEEFAGESLRQARQQHNGSVLEIVNNSPAANTSEGEDIAARAKGLSRIAERINLDGIQSGSDLFAVEAAVRRVPVAERTPDMQEYLAQARQVRVAAENQVLREYRESLISEMRKAPEAPPVTISRPLRKPTRVEKIALSDEAIALAAREIVNLGDQRSIAQRLADDNSGEYATPEQKAKAQEYQDAADFAERKQNAVMVAAQVVRGAAAVGMGDPVPLVMGRATYIRLNSGEEVPAHYAVAEMGNLIASHEPLEGFRPDARFPEELQPRDYEKNKESQAAVLARSNAPDSNIYHSDTVQATDGPPIIRRDGLVFSGNGREQSAEMAAKNGKWEAVRADLLNRAQRFGVNPEEIAKHNNPILVRVMDVPVTDPAEMARYGLEMNQGSGQGLDPNERRAALSRLLTPSVIERLANIFKSVSSDTTLRAAMRARSPDLAKVLTEAGLVDPTKRAEYFTEDGDLAEEAKTMIEEALAGSTVSNPKVLTGISPSVMDKLGRVGIDFIIMRAAGESWNLASYNTDAVQLTKRVADAATRLGDLSGPGRYGEGTNYSSVERFLHPERFENSTIEMSFDGQALHPPVHPVVEALALALEKSPRAYRELIGSFADSARDGGMTMFGALSPAEAFNNTIGGKFGIEVVPEEWGMVNGLPDAVKSEIEQARGPLPVEPPRQDEVVISDIQPDISSVTDAKRGAEVRSVREFRDAIASHPNITDEQAEAISDIFERVLPNATGESFADILRNRRLSISMGGEQGGRRGYTEFIDEANAAIHLFESANPSTVMHEMFHFLRQYLKPEHQAALNEFVEAKAGGEWTVEQEEKAAQAFERYHFDGGRRRGALEKAFAVIHKAMQAVYDAVTGRELINPTPRIREMFDRWYDWERSERKPITARVDVDALVDAAKNPRVQIPRGAKILEETAHVEKNAQSFVFTSKDQASDFIDKNSKTIRTYQLLDGKDGQFYVRASFQPGAKRLYQGGMASIGDLARQAKTLEEQLKKAQDPREEARFRAQLASIENRLGGSTLIFGDKPEPRDNEATQLIYGLGEMPSVQTPTTPAQAMQARQVTGDPTEVEVRANGNKRDVRTLPDETSGLSKSDGVAEVSEGSGSTDGRNKTAREPVRGRKSTDEGDGGDIATPAVNPLADIPAASLKAPTRKRGTPLADPEAWRAHVAALGLPEGTPPPTVRIPDDLRSMMIYPGQSEAIEIALSGLQQHDAVILASSTGTGKTFMGLSIADQLLGNDSSKVGLIVTISQNLIHQPDGYVETGQRLGVQIESLPKDMSEVQGGGVYAATYTGIRGNSEILSIPWDFVIFDESAAGRKWTESEQGKAVTLLGHAAKKVVYMSATPWHTALEVGYAHKLGLWPEGGFFEWGRQFGLRQVGPNSYSGGYAPKKMMKLRQQLIERGQWVSLHRDLDGVSAHVAMVAQTPEVKQGIGKIRDAFALAAKVFAQRGMSSMAASLKGNEVTYLKRYIEASRLPEVLAKAKEAIAGGWYPTIFSEYRSGSKEEVDGKIDDMFSKLPPGVGDHVRAMLPKLPNLVEAVRKELGEDAAIFAGDANQLREEERTAFQNGKKRGLFTTYAAGGTGVSFHDRVGDKPRMGLFLGLPWSGIMFEQSQGRTWRYGTKSNVANIFFTSDTLPEMKVLATKILPRMRALNAAVFGEEMESKLSKNLRESSGIAEELVDYEMGNEAAPDAAQFETTATGAGYTPASELELPKSSDAKNKGMKYKTQPKRLYQGPEDVPGKDAADEFDKLPLDTLPPSMRRAIESNRVRIQASAYEAARQAVPGVEAPAQAIRRVTKDNLLNTKMLYAMHDVKKDSRAVGAFAKNMVRLFNTAGDRAVWRYFDEAGMGKEGKEIQRKLVERNHLITKHRGDMLDTVSDITQDISPQEHSLVVKVLEGLAPTADPKIQAAADGYRKFFADVKKRLGDAGAVFKTPDSEGKMVEIPWKDFGENPNYFPHIWDWNQKLVFKDAQGKSYVKTLGEIYDTNPGEERDELIEKYAAQHGISRIQAHEFFAKDRRTIRLAPNLERMREGTMPGYDTSMRAVLIYVNQAAEMLANIATVGQEREKINPLIYQLPTNSMRMVDSIITADLNPLSIGQDNSRFLRKASQWVVLSKMGMGVLKLPTHVMLKTPLVTDTRSMIAGMLDFARHPMEVTRSAREAGILTDYVRQAMMMEYGLHDDSGFDRKMLKYTGFTSSIWLSRVVAGAAGRHFLTVHAEPALRKNPADTVLRRKLSDLYGFSDEDLDRIATKGIDENDVKRSMIAAADWTTGSGRASELPPALRAAGDDHPITGNLRTLLRMAFLLKTYAFKTASLVNRTVFDEVGQKNFKPLLRLLVTGGASGLALNMLQMGINSVANPAAAEEQKRRFAAIKDHPQGALWLEGANLSYALGLYPAKVLFDHLGTYDEGDKKKAASQKRLEQAFSEELGGILGSDADHLKNASIEWAQTFEDDGINHRATPEERRAAIVSRLFQEWIAPVRAVKGAVSLISGPTPSTGDGYVPHRRTKRTAHHAVPQ